MQKVKNMTLEVSLKPFRQTNPAYVEAVCKEIFTQWRPLVKDAATVSILLWTSDGSELLDYDGCPDTPFEWAYWVGNANATPATHASRSDPEGVGLHSRPWRYLPEPPVMTYGILKRIVATLRRVGGEILEGKPIRVGTTFDPGPEFAKSDFKYRRHNEICRGNTIGVKSFVCSYATLHGDDRPYAGYPNGIPEGLPFGRFFGRQAQCFLGDMGFDYIWFSNGLGFGRDTWSTTGAVFDGTRFSGEALAEVRESVFAFWKLFREECPSYPIETRGTNMTMGIDFASDGVPLKEVYEAGLGILPPPNSPWAALDGDFGLELAGYMSRIAELPGEEFLFRYYLHDPWWVNSPWYDRYNGMPHDIYLPLGISRINAAGQVCSPTHFNILSIDNTYGELSEQCANEVIPHLKKGFKDAPDAPAPLTWVYPFREYSACRDDRMIEEIFAGDWFVRSAINAGAPVAGVVSTSHFLGHKKELYEGSILLTPVPEAESAFEDAILSYLEAGGRVIFYGSTRRASPRFLHTVGVKNVPEGAEGVLPLTLHGHACGRIKHTPLIGGGSLTEVCESEMGLAFAGERVIATRGRGFVWLRGLASNDFLPGKKRLIPQKETEYYPVERLLLCALKEMGYSIRFEKEAEQPSPVVMLHRHDNGYVYAQYSPCNAVKTLLKLPLGAPILDGYDVRLEEGCAAYHFPKAERRECRVFVEQREGVVFCQERHPCSAELRRRIRVGGLKNATVRFLAEGYCKEQVEVRLNPVGDACLVSEPLEVTYGKAEGMTYCEVHNVTGTLVFSLPMRKTDFTKVSFS